MTTTAVAARVLDALGDALRRRGGVQLEDLVDALAEPLSDSDDLLAVTDRGWAAAFDLDTTPQPRWLGAAIGTRMPGGLTPEQQRDYIRERAYWRRGTPRAIKAAAATALTGLTRRVDIIERYGSPWRFKLRVWALEAPDDLRLVVKAAAAEKPVGLVIDPDVEVIPYQATFAHMTAEHGTFAELAARFPTFDLMTSHVPEEGTRF